MDGAAILAAGARLALLYERGQADPSAICAFYLDRIAQWDATLKAVTLILDDQARAAATDATGRWARGAPLSPLDGVPVLVKANIAVQGVPWHAGIKAYSDRLARADAAVIGRLKALGAVVLGLANMHEGALGATTDNPWFGRCDNPYKEGYTPGGSSGGSAAAVAAGLCAFALGTDTLGSVRVPSSYCGIVGLKPSAESGITNDGVVPLSWTLDRVGLHTRSVFDADLVHGVLSDTRSAHEAVAKRDLKGLRVGRVVWSDAIPTDAEVLAASDAALTVAANAGAKLLDLPVSGKDLSRFRRRGLLISEAEAMAVHEDRLTAAPSGFSPEFTGLMTYGATQPGLKIVKAYREITEARDLLRNHLDTVDALIMPTTPQAAFAYGDPVPETQADYTALASLADCPALALPYGTQAEGLPLSVQIVARPDRINALFHIARILEGPTPENRIAPRFRA